MYISPISNYQKQQKAFHAKYKPIDSKFNFKNFEKQIDKMSKDKNAKNMFASLSMIAASLIAEFSVFASENPEVRKYTNKAIKELGLGENESVLSKLGEIYAPQNKNESHKELNLATLDYSALFEEKPERNKYLAITAYFPNLDAKYQELLIKSLTEPKNEENKFVLDSIENIFNILSADNGLKYRKSYFEALNEKSDCLSGIAQNVVSAVKNGESPMRYLVLLNNGKLSKEDIYKWAKYENLKCDEFMLLKPYDEYIMNKINVLKETNSNFEITSFEESSKAKYITNYYLKLNFPEHLSLEDKLKTIADVHRAIYGEIYVKGEKDREEKFLKADIQTEMLDSVIKDSQMDAVYNFVKFMNPKALKNIKLTSEEVKCLDKESDLYKQIQSICTKEIVSMNFESPKIKEITEVMGNDDIFGDLITTRHARMRFITRFVLKDNPNAKLTEECKTKMEILKQELEDELDICNYYCFSNKTGTAPQFYIKDSKLGHYVKITLNNKGTIHTIYEDFKKIQNKK